MRLRHPSSFQAPGALPARRYGKDTRRGLQAQTHNVPGTHLQKCLALPVMPGSTRPGAHGHRHRKGNRRWDGHHREPQLLTDRMAARIMDLHTPAFARTTKVWRHTEILLETDIRFLYYVDGTCAAEKVNVYAVCCSHHVQVVPSLANKFA